MALLRRISSIVLNGYTLVTLLIAAGIGTFWSDIIHSDPWVQAIWALAVVLALALLIRHGGAIWERMTKSDAPLANINQTMVGISEGATIEGLEVSGNRMTAGPIGSAPPRSPRRVRSSPEYLAALRVSIMELAARVAAISNDPVDQFAYEAALLEPGSDLESVYRKKRAETGSRYQAMYPELGRVYGDARSRGFSDEVIERFFTLGFPVQPEEMAVRLGSLAGQIDPKSQGSFPFRFRRRG